nr:hypothetical protein Iba_chr10dCG10320 [Ipomoea batatas]GMD76129.1 hypothetical protein Iba_chr13bCG7360 [Ipomoea batatas]
MSSSYTTKLANCHPTILAFLHFLPPKLLLLHSLLLQSKLVPAKHVNIYHNSSIADCFHFRDFILEHSNYFFSPKNPWRTQVFNSSTHTKQSPVHQSGNHRRHSLGLPPRMDHRRWSSKSRN